LFHDKYEAVVGKADTRTSGVYSQLDDEQKAAAVQKAFEYAREAAKEELVNRINARKESVMKKPEKLKFALVGAE
jgi:hypothetical protein